MPEPSGYILSQADVALLKQVVHHFKNTPLNPRNRPHFDDEPVTQDIYLARTPNSGIPALVRSADAAHHDLPGSALCDIYHLTTVSDVTAIYSIPLFRKRVWNIADVAIGGNKWIVVNRTRAGYWLAQALNTVTIIGETGTGGRPLPPGTGVSPSSPCITDVGFGWLAGLIKKWDGIKLEVIASSGICTSINVPQTFHMRWDDGRQKWVTMKWRDSNNDFVDDLMEFGGGIGTGPGEATPVVFWIDNGRPRLQMETISYDLVGPVCSSAGYATFVGGTQVPCHGHPISTHCDNTFTIRLSCDCLSIRGWEGPGWYCIVDEPLPGTGSCPTRFFVAYLLEPDRCDTSIGICSGPYLSEAAATAACTPPSCPLTGAAGTPSTLTATITVISGSCTIADGATTTVGNTALNGQPPAYTSGGAGNNGFLLPNGGRDLALTCTGVGVWVFSCSGLSTDCTFFKDSTGGVACAAQTGPADGVTVVSTSPLHIRVHCYIRNGFDCTPCDNPTEIYIDFT